LERIRVDAEFAALIAWQLGRSDPAYLSMEDLIATDENGRIEFKSTARWNVREGRRDPRMEDEVIKTVAGFLNAEGGTLLIGIGPDRAVVGLEHDYPQVKPSNADGFVNWLTTCLINALGEAAVMTTRSRIVDYQGSEVCRIDVPAGTRPVWAKTSKSPRAFFVRMNNSTREMPEPEIALYWATRDVAQEKQAPQLGPAKPDPFQLVVPIDAERYETCVPLVSLRAAAGQFGEAQEVEPLGWVTFETAHGLRKGMFVAQVLGRSMEPLIPDCSYCLFLGPVAGTRQGKILLVQHHAISDPENGGSYTVKRYSSTKEEVESSWRHKEVRLEPINPTFAAVILRDVAEDEFRVIAEMLQVLK